MVDAFVLKAKSALYRSEGDKRPLSPLGAFLVAGERYPEAKSAWLKMLEETGDDGFKDIIERVPSEVMSRISKDFAFEMVRVNRQNLLEPKSP